MTITIQRGSLAHLAIFIPLRALIHTLEALWATLATICGWWRPLALAAGIIGAVAICAVCPLLPLGLAIVTAFALVTMPKKAVAA